MVLRSVVKSLVAAALAWAAGAACAQGGVPPAEYRPPVVASAPVPRLLLAPGAPVRTIALAAPTAEETARLASRNAGTGAPPKVRGKGARLAVGFARDVPAGEASVRLADLPWRSVNGQRVAQVALDSPGAAALRLGIALDGAPPGLVLRVRGSAARAGVFGPYGVADVAYEPLWWSPVLEGATATIEIALPQDAALGQAALRVPQVSHLVAAGAQLRAAGDWAIGQAGACEVDIACLPPAQQRQMSSATNAVARMLVTIQGTTYLCSGTLLNDSITSYTPYYLTASHCLEDPDAVAQGRGTAAASAGTINTYWFLQAAACGSLAVPDYVLVAGGARLLARSVDYDWALVKLAAAPPSGATFAGWSAEGPLAAGSVVEGIHHPAGDLKKASEGATLPYQTFSDGSSYLQVVWSRGVTEGGSSGSGLFTYNAGANYYELRGTLTGGESSCSVPKGVDYYGRFDVAYPLVAQYVAPTAANPAHVTPVVEYYSAALDAYFITADPFEIAGRDNGSPAGWVRTGYRFLAYADAATAPAGAQPVCRLSSSAPYADTRFYSASAQECAAMLAQPGGNWLQESAAAFYIGAPAVAGGTCPAGTRSIFRLQDTLHAPRRRYTPEVDLRDALAATGRWQQEGGGSAASAVMCAPLAGAAMPAPAVANYSGLWWNAPAGSESGWGLNFAHQGDTLFATWFTFDVDGSPLWMVVAAPRVAPNTYVGTLYRGTGPAWNAVPFDPQKVVGAAVGTATFAFDDPGNGTFTYAIGGTTQAKSITRQVFASPMPTCTSGGQANPADATNYQDIWWGAPAGSESGWGLNVAQQGDTIFATWFTYGLDGRPLWFAVSAAPTAPKVWSGALYTGTGPAYNAAQFDSKKVLAVPAGTATLAFADGNSATFAYTINGVSQSKAITREIFAPPGTVCR